MSSLNPITRLYDDVVSILKNMVIKYSAKADEYETLEIRSYAEEYMAAYTKVDNFYTYEYEYDDYVSCGISDDDTIVAYLNNEELVPESLRNKLLKYRRDRVIAEYDEQNDYYRMLHGLPDLDDNEFFYVPEEYCIEYGIDPTVPVHKVEDVCGIDAITALEGVGYLDKLREEHPDKKYLIHVGPKRIGIYEARRAKNFAILYLSQIDIRESIYREFISSYEQARTYFMSTAYNYQYRNLIDYYDNFIALCIFIMAIQRVSVKAIENATDREFYDDYCVQLLYETYGVPFSDRIDENTQKQIVQNLNLLVQNKASNKVLIDIASILGFSNIEIYQYFLMKERLFDDKGRPIVKYTNRVNTSTGQVEQVLDNEAMYDLHFQKVDIQEPNLYKALSESKNRVNYNDIVYYDPFWWEDDELHSEIWEREYSFIETKYMGATIPYRLTGLVFDSVILLKMILDQHKNEKDLMVELPKITENPVSIVHTIVLLCAMMSKKYHISGEILSSPSKIIHALEVLDQDINCEEDHIEALGFNFDAFTKENIDKTKKILEDFLIERDYFGANGHDIDVNEKGIQDTYSPTHLANYELNLKEVNKFYEYLSKLSIESTDVSKADKVKALNTIYTNMKCLYQFISHRMSTTNDYKEYYALKKFYEAAFYSDETFKVFGSTNEKGERELPKTFLEYLKKNNPELYIFVRDCPEDNLYEYIDHIIYKLEGMISDIGSLYNRNDGFSPLQELLQTLIVFFKSFTVDLVDFGSTLIVDWRMENIVRFFEHPQYLGKTNEIRDDLGTLNMGDVIHRFTVKFMVESWVKFNDTTTLHATIRESDDEKLHDNEEYKKMTKTIIPEDNFKLEAVESSANVKIGVEDHMSFRDDYLIIRRS